MITGLVRSGVGGGVFGGHCCGVLCVDRGAELGTGLATDGGE
jgi:hypothetical protein